MNLIQKDCSRRKNENRLKRMEKALEEFGELDNFDIPGKALLGVASEVNESKGAVKEAYSRMEKINEDLEKKLIVLNRASGVPDVMCVLPYSKFYLIGLVLIISVVIHLGLVLVVVQINYYIHPTPR